jgi:AbrB family transcriptional regulator, transcriptional pleiotropic regulator of transition state genes
VIKKIDNLGRVVVPKGYRLMLGLKPGDALDVEVDGDRLVIAPHRSGCTFCGDEDVAQAYLSKHICSNCIEQIRELPAS